MAIQNKYLAGWLLAGLIAISVACSSPHVIHDLRDTTYSLVNADSTAVQFPDDYLGHPTIISFIYTHCPDVCPIITANMKNIQDGLQDTSNIRFVEITFDPERDTPSVLAEYKNLFQLNSQFSLLTGQPAEIDSLLAKLDIKAQKTSVDSLQQDSSGYLMKHSNTIYIMDKEGRIRAEYPASLVPAENVIEDLQKIR